MNTRPSVSDPLWDAEQDRAPFRWRPARLGRQAESKERGASLFEVPSGAATLPLRPHRANEEMVVVLVGRPTLRTTDGERELAEGEVVSFPTGRRGSHRLENRTDGPVRILVVSTMIGPDAVEQP
ncbi:MAG TPA: cupin domain-containing protein [Thermoleophilaceae bacterium]|nr:cupin domain-containing protein [Thermoleophilaceae bacterium]